ncbi:MAG: hypothetical protein AB7I27_14165 [Bacteriovoracaceae bacterium]
MKTFIICLVLTISSAFASSNAVLEETLYQNYKLKIESGLENKTILGFSSYDQSLLVDALWDSLDEGTNKNNLSTLHNLQDFHFSLVEKLRLGILKVAYDDAKTLDPVLVGELLNELRSPEVEVKLIYILAAHEKILLAAGHKDIIDLAKTHNEYGDISQDRQESDDQVLAEVITDLYFNTPDVSSYMDGEYVKSVKIFMFCHNNRLYPCMMVMKDVNGKEVRNSDGTLWTHQVLASAKTGLPSYQRNGNTPAGILTIDSVMPVADQQISYGKFRRMMLNFIPKSKEEVLMKSLLPKSSWGHDWWNASTVARDIGRNMFRIHGTGKINTDSNSPYYPFVRTSGCIANKENTYDGVTYTNQRLLLDTIMTNMGLKPTFENEPKIKGILYLIELDDTNGATTVEELKQFGIE